jgi:tRNA A-37 threonylcarbamoyl transferase component Bud32
MKRDDELNADALMGFYDAGDDSLSDQERQELTPILNSLKDFHDRYEKLVVIGKGAEKEIYRVYDRRLGRRVALAYPVKAKSSDELEQFLREARLTANLTHPNIMPVHNMGIDPDGKPFFTMELLPGDSLKDIVAGLRKRESAYVSRYSLDALLSIYLKICDAMAYAHSRGVLHLDLKPSNIRVGPFGDVFVCDWGLARIIHGRETGELEPGELDGDELNDFTLSGTMKGTPGFMAPEQAGGKEEKTVRTDIYALGAILYMLLVHEIPVPGDSANEVVENTVAGHIILPHRRKPQVHVPASLEAVAMKALSLKPQERYAHVQDLQAEIANYMTGYATDAEKAGMVRRVVLLTQRHARIALLSVMSLAVLVAVAGVAIVRVDMARADAVEAKGIAESNFELYRHELEVSQQLNRDVLQMLEYIAVQPDMRHPFFNIELLEKKLAGDVAPELRREMLAQKGILHFIVEEFHAAAACFEASGVGYSERLLPVARLFARMKPDDKALLRESELAEMFVTQKPVFKQFTYYTFLHHMRRNPDPDLEEYAVLAGSLLEEMNGPRPTRTLRLPLQRGREGYILDLSGKPYSRFKLLIPGVLYQNVLEPYEFERLDVSHTPITDMMELEDLKVKTLRMTGLEWMTSDLHLVARLKKMGVQTLVVEQGRFSGSLRERLEKNLTLIEE